MQLKFVEEDCGDRWRCWIEDMHGWQAERISGGWQFMRTLQNATLTILLDLDPVDRRYIKYTMIYTHAGHCFRHACGACEKSKMEEWLSQTATELTR